MYQLAGRVSDEELVGLYRRARCLVFPQVEDFGIVAVEAQACGCPVVARRAGGALDSVIDGETGAFFEREDPDAIVRAAVMTSERMAPACRTNALRFSVATFDHAIGAVLDEMLD